MRKLTNSEMQTINGGWKCAFCGKNFPVFRVFAWIRHVNALGRAC